MRQSTERNQQLLQRGVLAILLISCLTASGCNRARVPLNTDDYVEIDNPILDGNPSENTKIWVPKSSLSKGVPRGRDLSQKGYDAVVGKNSGGDTNRAAAENIESVHQRPLIVAEGGSALGKQLSDLLKNNFTIRPAGRPAPAPAQSDLDKQAYIVALAAQPGSGPIVYLSSTDGIKVGSIIKAELFDSRGPVLLRSLTVKVPAPENDETEAESLQRALGGLAGAVHELLHRLPWYGRVVAVKGDRVYLDSGAESGLKAGQKIRIYRGGDVVPGVGFAPGERIAAGIAITDLVGPDGAYTAFSEAAKVQPGDYVELDK
jgi:hypothetical protein